MKLVLSLAAMLVAAISVWAVVSNIRHKEQNPWESDPLVVESKDTNASGEKNAGALSGTSTQPKSSSELDELDWAHATVVKGYTPSLFTHIADFFTGIRADAEAAKRSAIINKSLPRSINGVVRYEKTVAGPGKRITYTLTMLTLHSLPEEVKKWEAGYDTRQNTMALDSELQSFYKNGITVVRDFYDCEGKSILLIEVSPEFAEKAVAEKEREDAKWDAQLSDLRLDSERLAAERGKEEAEARKKEEAISAELSRSLEQIDRDSAAELRRSMAEINANYERGRQEREIRLQQSLAESRAAGEREKTRLATEAAKEESDRNARELISIQNDQLKLLQKQTETLQQIESRQSQEALDKINGGR